MFKKILVPVDGSEGGFEALKMAIELQKMCDAELLILSVYREHRSWNSSVSLVNQDLTSSTDEALESFARHLGLVDVESLGAQLDAVARHADAAFDQIDFELLWRPEDDDVAALDVAPGQDVGERSRLFAEDESVDDQMVTDEERVDHRLARNVEGLEDESVGEAKKDPGDHEGLEILAKGRAGTFNAGFGAGRLRHDGFPEGRLASVTTAVTSGKDERAGGPPIGDGWARWSAAHRAQKPLHPATAARPEGRGEQKLEVPRRFAAGSLVEPSPEAFE